MAQFSVNASRFDPFKNFEFRVKGDGKYVAGVSKVSGLKRTTEVVEHREGRRLVARAESARELLGSRELRAAARRVPELGRSIESAPAELDRQDAAAEQSRSELHDASKEWLEALRTLRNPGG
ncbi:phage tail protein [Microbacterium sp. LWH3-1.2]|uniref:phage tail protein n=1 Tax=Microbacterium sp. LWH3-1.2 TaxID=3135256 RepID=UPI0034465547